MAESARQLGAINNNNKGTSMKALRACKTLLSPKKFVLRLPPNVHAKVFLTAKKHHRSMNAEIIHHLERSLPSPLSIETQPHDNNEAMINEEQYLSLLRALPTHKRSALFALLEIDGVTVDAP